MIVDGCMVNTLYDALGLSKAASQDDIKKAYRKLMKQLHPDLNPGDAAGEERFKKVAAAYEIIGDKDLRKRYDAGDIDETGAETPQQQYYRQYADTDAANPYANQTGYGDMGDMDDLFQQMFRNRQGQGQGQARAAMRGTDRRYHMKVSFLDAAFGGSKQVQMADGANLKIQIPRGIDDGKVIRLKGKGEPGHNGGPAGDAYIQIEVEPHPVFKRNGLDIELSLPITVYEAGLGARIEAPTLRGPVGLKIPAGANSGKVLRLKGRGIETASGGKGDQLVTLQVEMPASTGSTAPDFKTLLETWRDKHAYDPRATMMKGAAHV